MALTGWLDRTVWETAPMRVHLGSDHAGLELKEHLIDWLATTATSRVDHGPFVYDALDDYPCSACGRPRPSVGRHPAASASSSAGPATASRSRPTRSKGVRARAGVERRDRPARAAAQRRQRGLRRRPDAHVEDMIRFVEVFLDDAFSGESGTPAGSRCSPTTRRPATCRRCPSPPRPPDRPRCLRATPSTGSPHDLDAAFAGRPSRVSSPQGRFADRGRAARRHRLLGAPSRTASTFRRASRATGCVHVHLGLYGKFDVHDGAGCRRRRPGPAAAGRAATAGVRRPARRHRVRADHPRAPQAVVAGSGPTRCAPTPTRTGPGRRIPQPRADRRAADGPGGAGRRRQRLPRRGAVPAPGRPAAARAARCAASRWEAMWDDLVVLMAEGVRTAASTPCGPSTRPEAWAGRRARTTTAARSTSTAAPASLPRVRHRSGPGAGRPQPVLVPAVPAAGSAPAPRRG